MMILGLAVLFKTMNQFSPTVTVFGGLFFGKYKRWRTSNFDTIFIQVFNLSYYNLESIFLIVWKLWSETMKQTSKWNYEANFEANEIPTSSYIWVASTKFKQF